MAKGTFLKKLGNGNKGKKIETGVVHMIKVCSGPVPLCPPLRSL
ncbi:MAG: hypothetical protein WBP74_12015 [Nitrososphaeraceae archaeon]